MKIHCPECGVAHSIPDENFTRPTMKAACPECGTRMQISRESGTAEAIPDPNDSMLEHPQTQPSVSSMSSEYPEHRDAIIIVCVILIIAAILGGGYFLSRYVEKSYEKFAENPVEYLVNLMNALKGGETVEICESFLRRYERRYSRLGLGRNPKFFLLREDIRIVDRKKTARTIIKIQGSKGIKIIHFWLRKSKGKWHIVSATIDRGKGKYEKLYPPR